MQASSNTLANCEKELQDARNELAKSIKKDARRNTQLALKTQQLNQLRNLSFIQFGANLASLILVGIGINLITATPPDNIGWAMISLSILLQITSFFTPLTIGSRKKKH